jgi:hypothetical protein
MQVPSKLETSQRQANCARHTPNSKNQPRNRRSNQPTNQQTRNPRGTSGNQGTLEGASRESGNPRGSLPGGRGNLKEASQAAGVPSRKPRGWGTFNNYLRKRGPRMQALTRKTRRIRRLMRRYRTWKSLCTTLGHILPIYSLQWATRYMIYDK